MTPVFALTLFHVVVSLVAVVAGAALILRLMANGDDRRPAAWFLISMAITLASGFVFPFKGITPALAVGFISVLILAPTLYARYRTVLTGLWRPVYVIGVTLLAFFNTLVLIIQSFQKIGPLNALAPVGNEPPVLVSQGLLLVLTLAVGTIAILRFRPLLPAPLTVAPPVYQAPEA